VISDDSATWAHTGAAKTVAAFAPAALSTSRLDNRPLVIERFPSARSARGMPGILADSAPYRPSMPYPPPRPDLGQGPPIGVTQASQPSGGLLKRSNSPVRYRPTRRERQCLKLESKTPKANRYQSLVGTIRAHPVEGSITSAQFHQAMPVPPQGLPSPSLR